MGVKNRYPFPPSPLKGAECGTGGWEGKDKRKLYFLVELRFKYTACCNMYTCIANYESAFLMIPDCTPFLWAAFKLLHTKQPLY